MARAESTATSRSTTPLSEKLTMAGTCVVAVALLLGFALADGQMFEDAEYSRLYQFTLEQAYSRFKASDKQVPAKGSADPLDNALVNGPATQPPNRQALQRLQRFGSPQAGNPLQLPARNRQAAGAAPAAADDGGPHTLKGNEHLRKREFEPAVREFHLALQENPRRLITRHSLADALRFLNRTDEAIAQYQEVLKQNPQYYCCFTHIGDAEKGRNNTAAAEKAYAAAIDGYRQQISQTGSGQGASIARYHLAKLYNDLNRDLAEALKMAEQANAETPNQLAQTQLLAQLYEKVGRNADAARMYQELARLNPQHAAFFQQQQQRLTKNPSPAKP